MKPRVRGGNQYAGRKAPIRSAGRRLPSGWIVAGALIGAGALLSAGPPRLENEFKAMAETERAFARTCAEKGIRQSFYEFFAEDGIAFRPHPVKLREFLRTQTAPATPSPVLLEWEPTYGDISRSADLGWLTGPTLFIDKSEPNSPPRYGYYSSVWKKQADGTWRVALDLGVSTPPQAGPIPRGRLRRAPREKFGIPVAGTPSDLRQAEQEMARDANEGAILAYRKYLASSGRIHRDGHEPFTASPAILEFLATQPRSGSWETLYAEVAKSDDLGYTFGKYELQREGAVAEKGYYMRVWKRNAAGNWKLVLDVTNALPPEKS